MNQERGGSTVTAWYYREDKSYAIARAMTNSLTLEFNPVHNKH